MNTKLALGAVAAAVAVFSQGAFAQASSPTRAEVKAQAKTGALAPAGEAVQSPMPAASSDKTRAARKSTTKGDRATGGLKATGETADKNDGAASKSSDTTRADRKATTKADRAAGTLKPAGEAPQPVAAPTQK
jgi:hypothetical protein